MSTNIEEYFSFLRQEIAPIYQGVKKTLIEAETHDPLKRTYLAPYNELRNTLDHVMKSVLSTDEKDFINNLKEAKVHINRAGYDVYEILASNLSIYITNVMDKYPSSIIARVFPKYYDEIQPLLVKIQNEIITIRSNKNVDGEISPEPFSKYEKNKDCLIEIVQTINGHIPILEKEKRKSKFSWLINNTVGIIIGVIIGLIVGIVLYYLFTEAS
jgi:hypothetical protein